MHLYLFIEWEGYITLLSFTGELDSISNKVIGFIFLWQDDVSKYYRVQPLAQVLLDKHDIPFVGK